MFEHFDLEPAVDQKLQLVVMEGNTVTAHDLPRIASIVIGRGPDVAIRLGNPRVSTRHARLHVEGGRVSIEDLESRNGTQVRGERIPSNRLVPLAVGEVATLGSAVLMVQPRG